MMSRGISSISVDSWAEAVRTSDSLTAQFQKMYYAVEYQEHNSPDGMCFYEAANKSTIEMLKAQYKIVRIL